MKKEFTKKIFSLCLAMALGIGLVGCGGGNASNNDSAESSDSADSSSDSATKTESTGDAEWQIVVLEGPMGQSAQLQRWEGITNVLEDYPNIEIIAYNTANWSRSEAQSLMETWLTTYGDEIDAVVAENDEMALGARVAIDEMGYDIPCIGIDGITDAKTAVQNGGMIASDFQDAEGQITGAIAKAVDIVNGKSEGGPDNITWIPFQMITPENVEEFLGDYAAPTDKYDGAEGLKIAATYYTLQTEFCMRMDNAAKVWCEANGINYQSQDGNNDAKSQLDQVETFIANGVDAIILNPQDAVACAACVDAAVEAGIPIVGVNTMVESDKLSGYVGSEDVSAGEEIMMSMINYLGIDKP